MDTPVALFTFNRPDSTRQVFNEIRAARPRTLFLICDGPRHDKPGECDEVRKILESVDWPCKVHRDYSSENLGCRRRMISGISWVFSQVPEAIILEDDCLPSPSFFPFAAEMLERYRDDPNVMMVSGSNLVSGKKVGEYSYSFVRSVGIWGWATWARSWKLYDEQISQWPKLRESKWLLTILDDRQQSRYWRQKFDDVHQGAGTWDWQWGFSVWANNGLSVIPSQNLVKNLGFSGGGSSGLTEQTPWIKEIMKIPRCEMEFPLVHPQAVKIDRKLDKRIFKKAYAPQSPLPEYRLLRAWQLLRSGKLKSLLGSCLRLGRIRPSE